VHHWLYEIIFIAETDGCAFLATGVEVALSNICVGLIAWPLCAFETRRFGEFEIAIHVEEKRLMFFVFGTEGLHAGAGLEGRKDDVIFL
jgi:hypothetical protein